MSACGSIYRMGVDALICRLTGAAFLACVAVQALADRGALNPDVTQDTIAQTICVPGYTKSVRPSTSFTNGVKMLLLKCSGLDASTAPDYELDHVIPLALGGHPRKLDNLKLQPWDEAKRKDRIEVKLQCLVCSGQVPLEIARCNPISVPSTIDPQSTYKSGNTVQTNGATSRRATAHPAS